ncbi:maltase 1-like [Cylas formicarius]|uniref:maltase 1-like n=1 Tax=Cylas formicarius TaxID=197179 RepID=UPI0029585DDE|nr:maltase 1-like [Cylas formicarius]
MDPRLLFFVLTIAAVHCKDWWQSATFYQVYPRSFKDSDNDGTGDLQGIIQKLDYLVETGVQAVWLSPIYQSPMVDGGYDISDYRAIAPEYGTLEDFKQLVQSAHDKGLKVILDFVPNHTSDQHEWFQKSVSREAGYEDYYLWVDGKVGDDGQIVPPNNWLSLWRNSGWEWNEVRQQYYLHQFSSKQPDLNYRSASVHNEMKDTMKFWLDLGVDGFRVDAVPHIYEDAQLRDEPLSNNSGVDPNNYDYLDHVYTKDQFETFQLIYDWRDFIDNYTATAGGDTRIFMTESATSIENVILYYGTATGSRLGAHFSFNFYLLGADESYKPADICSSVVLWAIDLPSIYTANWLTGNHDNHRVATRVGPRNVDGYNMLISIMDGVTITYMGEEIGQENGQVTCAQGHDPSAIGNCSTFDDLTRDFERTPFQWDDSVNAGFNEGAETWLPVSDKYNETNLADQQKNNKSHYHTYQKLMKLKQTIANQVANETTGFTIGGCDANVLFYEKQFDDLKYRLVFNLGPQQETTYLDAKDRYTVLVSSVNSTYETGQIIEDSQIVLAPGDSVIVTNQ